MRPAPQIAFLSLSRARTPDLHRAVNQWHQLDHRPENLALDGVAWGERWVLPPAAADQAVAGSEFADFHYANLYWLDEPHRESIETWAEFAEQSFREGRRPDVPLVDRAYMDFFRLVGTAASPGIRMNPRSLVFRPGTGVLMTATSYPDDLDRTALHAAYGWELEVLLPALARVPGVATAWCLQSDTSLAPPAWAAREAANGTDAGRIVRLILASTEIDPPATVLERVRAAELERPPGLAAGRTDFQGALETITPWQWSWFDERTEA